MDNKFLSIDVRGEKEILVSIKKTLWGWNMNLFPTTIE
jgi:hypothetical protein